MAQNEAEGPPFKVPDLPSEELLSLIDKTATVGLSTKFLVSHDPKPELITCKLSKEQFILCLAQNLANKPVPKKKKPENPPAKDEKSEKPKPKKKKFDPFMGPFVKGSHICTLIPSKYELILNKFPVLPRHVSIISTPYIEQSTPLGKEEFNGEHSGATQS